MINQKNQVDCVPAALTRVVFPTETRLLPQVGTTRVLRVLNASVGSVTEEAGLTQFAGVAMHKDGGNVGIIGRTETYNGEPITTGKMVFAGAASKNELLPEVNFTVSRMHLDPRTVTDAMVAFELQVTGSLTKGERRRLIASYREHFGALHFIEQMDGQVMVSVSDQSSPDLAAAQLAELKLAPKAVRDEVKEDVQFYLPRSRVSITRFGAIETKGEPVANKPIVRAMILAR